MRDFPFIIRYASDVTPNNPPPIDRWNSHNTKENKHIGIIVALLLAVALHIGLFLYLGDIQFLKKATESDFETEQVFVEQSSTEEVQEVTPPPLEQTIPDLAEEQAPIPELDDILPELKNQDLDIRTDIEEPELSIKMSTPAKLGDLEGALDDVLLSASSITALEDLGTGLTNNSLAAEGQLVIKEGSVTGELMDPNEILDDSVLKGIGGFARDGVMEGYNSLDEMLSMSPVNLEGARTALPSDLLYEYDSATLKSTARFGLMKLGMLIDRNPDMFCILEGHSDTFGGDSYNLKLSQERAQSVKTYLVESLRLGGKNIIVKGLGKRKPLISEGSAEAQAPNRRVDILMRKEIPKSHRNSHTASIRITTVKPVVKPLPTAPPVTPPPASVRETTPPVRAIIVEEPAPAPRRAIVVQPARIPASIPRRAIIVEEPPVPRAIIIEE